MYETAKKIVDLVIEIFFPLLFFLSPLGSGTVTDLLLFQIIFLLMLLTMLTSLTCNEHVSYHECQERIPFLHFYSFLFSLKFPLPFVRT